MMTIDDNYLRSCTQFNPAMTVEEYFSAVERYMRMIWDDSLFPEKELREKQSMICDVEELA